MHFDIELNLHIYKNYVDRDVIRGNEQFVF